MHNNQGGIYLLRALLKGPPGIWQVTPSRLLLGYITSRVYTGADSLYTTEKHPCYSELSFCEIV